MANHHSSRNDTAENHSFDKSLLLQFLKIAALAMQARDSADYHGDSHTALNIIREAHTLTRQWADIAFEELHQHSSAKEPHHLKEERFVEESNQSSFALLAKLAFKGWRASKAQGDKRHSLKLEILQEIYSVLVIHMHEADREIRRLERKLGLRRRERREHKDSDREILDQDDQNENEEDQDDVQT